MIPSLVVDVGNSRIKWGRCLAGCVAEGVSLAPDDPREWERQWRAWSLAAPVPAVVCGVQPAWRERVADWLRDRGSRVTLLTYAQSLPIQVALSEPDKIGIDRLLNAVAANQRRATGTPAVVVGAGTAVTVDWLDPEGIFRGGAILPGLRLMTQALHDYTALLPIVPIPEESPPIPGTSTAGAIQAGIYHAVIGGIRSLHDQLRRLSNSPPHLFLTGGDGPLLHRAMPETTELWPLMTLEGIRLTAEMLP